MPAGLLTTMISSFSKMISSGISSPIKPLGSYDLAFNWHGTQASVTLKTVKGPMLLNGSGMFVNGSLQFSGTAQAEEGQEKGLANFLNLLGQSHREGDKDVIALEFK